LPPDRSATGSGLVIMVRQVGIALGVAILVAVMAVGPADQVGIHAVARGWIVIAIIAAAAPLPTLVLARRKVGKHRRTAAIARTSGVVPQPVCRHDVGTDTVL
jgi:hypothetical protein